MSDSTEVKPASANAGVVNSNGINITINVPPVPPAAPAVKPQAAKPAFKPPAVTRVPVPNSIGPLNPGFILPPLEVIVKESNDPNGHRIQTFTDFKGGTAQLVYGHEGTTTLTLSDATRTTTTNNKKRGFTGSTTYPVEQYGSKTPVPQAESAVGTDSANRWIFGDVNCGTGSVKYESNDVVDAVTRERIQAFAKEHPAIAAKLKEENVKLAVLGSTPVGMEQVLNAPANFQACPADARQGVLLRK